MIPEHELRQMYIDKNMSSIEIADKIGVSKASILRWMKKFDIKSRTCSEAQLVSTRIINIINNPLKPPKKDLVDMYYNMQMSQYEIANKIGVCQDTIMRWMQSYRIKSRTLSEAKIGEKHWNWHDGVSFEPYCKRFNNKFKEAVRIRDGYICQLCGFEQNGKKLDVHHIHYDKENCWPDVVALCRSCNAKVNSNRDYWEECFENQLIERGLMYWSLSQKET